MTAIANASSLLETATSNEAGLPHTQTFRFYEADEGEKMEFRLIYEGPLPSEKCEDRPSGPSRRAKDKHQLRKHFHLQLRELWEQHPDLRAQAKALCYLSDRGEEGKQLVFGVDRMGGNVKPYIDHIADSHVRCNSNRFVPLVSSDGGLTCALDILFLRRDAPGSVIRNGGDIDNRIKVLLDGLRMPVEVKELGGLAIDPNEEDPFYCLLEDDNLITKLTVETDRLIMPLTGSDHINDVRLVIHVTVVNPSALFAGGRIV